MSNSHSEFRAEVIIATSAPRCARRRRYDWSRRAPGSATALKSSQPGKSFRILGAEPFVSKAQPREWIPVFEIGGRNLDGYLEFRGDFAAFHARGNTVFHL